MQTVPVVVDVMLPGTDGLSLCRWIRGRSSLPVILLTARGEEADRIVGLELGADDYVTKPFSPRELAARVRSVLRRSDGTSPQRETIAFGEIELDGSSREARRGGSAVQLTAKEFELLWFLASHPRHVFSRDQLMARVWGYEAAVDTGTVTVHVRRLRGSRRSSSPVRSRHPSAVSERRPIPSPRAICPCGRPPVALGRSRNSRIRSTRWPRASSSSSTRDASSSRGRVTTSALRSRRSRRCSRRSKTASPRPRTISRRC